MELFTPKEIIYGLIVCVTGLCGILCRSINDRINERFKEHSELQNRRIKRIEKKLGIVEE